MTWSWLLVVAAGLPLDDLVKQQHGQMMRYWENRVRAVVPETPVLPPKQFRVSKRVIENSADQRIEEWRLGLGRALAVVPRGGQPSCVPVTILEEPDELLTGRLRGKNRRQILSRLGLTVGWPVEWLDQQSSICGPALAAWMHGSAVAHLKTLRAEHFSFLLERIRQRIDESEAIRRRRWRLLETKPEVASAALRAELAKFVGVRDEPRLPLKPELRLIAETAAYTVHEVLLPVLADMDAYGHLMIPKKLDGKQAAVIVQHGLGGQPKDLSCAGAAPDRAYHCLGAHLAEQGFVVFAPYVTHPVPQAELINPLAERARAAGAMRISAEVIKLRQIVDFLSLRPEIDAGRIGYYGLSYGGYSAIWMGALEPRLAAVVVSGHFNDWRRKITDLENPTSYMFHPDEDFYNADVLHRFTHVELIAAMWPRPVCVEFAERDATTTPAWHESAWSEVAAIAQAWRAPFVRDHFDGVHEIHGVGTVDFLNRYLRPSRAAGRDSGDLVSQRLGVPVRGEFYGEGAFAGIAFRVQRRGEALPLVVKYGSAPGLADLGRATVAGPGDGWVEARVPAVTLRRGASYYFEISTEAAAGSYELFGPRPLGGVRWERDFAVSFRLLDP